MTVLIHVTMSLDGFIADSDGNLDWALDFGRASAADISEITASITASIGATLGGRRGYDLAVKEGHQVYGGAWRGPQFVLTHRPADIPADPSFTFLSCGIREAVATAAAAAGDKDVVVLGASIAQQCLAEDLVDEMLIHLLPIVLGSGIALFGGPLFGGPPHQPIPLRLARCDQSGDIATLRFTRPQSQDARSHSQRPN
ncbi:MAG TPA: dihydrofolate reductase family protein [Streptosporangiaceae bacterium]|jgi:dihydrofolate reductase